MSLLQSSRYGLAVPKQKTGAVARRFAEWRRRLRRLIVGSGERRARLRTLIVLRWLGLVGQTFTILLVHFSLGFSLPLVPLLAAVALSALINLALELRFRATTRLTDRSAGLLLGYDVLQLSFLLALTGGLQNPFSVLLMVPITLSATILSLRTTILLCSMVTVAATLMGLYPTALPWDQGGLELPGLYVLALWAAIVLGSALIAGYAWRVADEARRLSNALAATQMALAREQQLSALSFTPSGDRLVAVLSTDTLSGAAETGSTMLSWDAPRFARQTEVRLGTDSIVTAVFTPDGDTLITAGTKGVIQLRDATTGRITEEFGQHAAEIRQLAVSPDGRKLASATTKDSTIRLWDLEAREPIATLSGHRAPLNEIVFSPDGTRLGSGGADTDVAIWRIDPDDAIELICGNLADARDPDLKEVGC